MKNITLMGVLGAIAFLSIGCGASSSNNGNAEDVSKHAYITTGSDIKIVDVQNPSNPVLKSTTPLDGAYKVSASNAKIVVAQDSTTSPYLSVFDVSNTSAPGLLASISKSSSLGQITDMFAENGTIYTTDEFHGVHVIDLLNGVYSPQVLGGADAMAVSKIGNTLYLIQQGGNNGLSAYDASVSSSLTLLNTNATGVATSSGSAQFGSFVYHSLMEARSADLIVASVSSVETKVKKIDASSLVVLAEVNVGGFVTGLAVHDDYAYITMYGGNSGTAYANGDDGVKIVDLSTMTVVANYPLNQASGVSYYEDHIYVVDKNGLHIFDVTNNTLSNPVDFADGAGNAITLGE